MRLTRKELDIVSAITRQYRQQHANAGGREVMEIFNRARATVLEARRDTLEAATAAPSFTWRKAAPRRS
ncbi:hypothetical protein ZQ37_001687 [Salmonella enterica subsp. enterica]|nr:hypothetical protein [Salmonella enterica subsp. enterica serovar Agbeni]